MSETLIMPGINRIRDASDVIPPAGAGDDGKVVTYDHGTDKYALVPQSQGVTDHAELDNLAYAASGHTGFEPAGAGAAAVAAHVALADPHTQYLLESLYTAADVLAKLLTVDGAGSGLDADLLDGYNVGTSANNIVKLDASAKLPAVDGSQLTNLPSGGGGTPGGSNTQIQFNDGGTFGGDADFTFDKTTNILSIGGDRIQTDRWLNTVYNTAIGRSAFGNNALSHVAGDEGYYNNAVGGEALYSNTIGYKNSAIGYIALRHNTTGFSNNAFGYRALLSNTTGFHNIGIGDSALVLNTTGAYNSAIGVNSLFNNGTGSNNVAIGTTASYTGTSASNNIAIGQNALYTNNANNNIGVGQSALEKNTTGVNNLGIGATACYKNTTANYNIGLGLQSLYNNQTGSYNFAVGVNALFSNASGAGNIGIGVNALYSALGNYNVGIGFEAGYSETGSNRLYIANTNTTKPLIYGEFDNAILKFHSTINSDTVPNTLSLVHRRSSGTPGAGLGVALRAGLHSSTTEDQDAGRLTWQWATATHASRASKGQLSAYYTTTERPAITWGADSSVALLSFYDVTTPIARQVLATGAGATVDDVISALQALGLVKQS